MKIWYYARGGEKFGPYSVAELKSLAESGELKPSDLLWKEGLPSWVPATSAKGLFPSNAIQSPPIPPVQATQAGQTTPIPPKSTGAPSNTTNNPKVDQQPSATTPEDRLSQFGVFDMWRERFQRLFHRTSRSILAGFFAAAVAVFIAVAYWSGDGGAPSCNGDDVKNTVVKIAMEKIQDELTGKLIVEKYVGAESILVEAHIPWKYDAVSEAAKGGNLTGAKLVQIQSLAKDLDETLATVTVSLTDIRAQSIEKEVRRVSCLAKIAMLEDGKELSSGNITYNAQKTVDTDDVVVEVTGGL